MCLEGTAGGVCARRGSFMCFSEARRAGTGAGVVAGGDVWEHTEIVQEEHLGVGLASEQQAGFLGRGVFQHSHLE